MKKKWDQSFKNRLAKASKTFQVKWLKTG